MAMKKIIVSSSLFLLLIFLRGSEGEVEDEALVTEKVYLDEGEVEDGALVTEKVYLDLSMGGEFAGRIEIGLFGTTSPKTVKNFVGLANHEVRP